MRNYESRISVILATYNGEKYIDAQLNSLASQTRFFDLIIHDDMSTDGTPEHISHFSEGRENVLVIPSHKVGGAKENFAYLSSITDADYILYCDQDDIWLNNKVEKLVEEIVKREVEFGKDVPILVHCDLALIDENGELISDSFWMHQSLNPYWGREFNLTLTQNTVTGCAMIINRELLKRALPIPEFTLMHDWWFALVASGQGNIFYLENPLILYRQHSNNAVGAKKISLSFILKKLWHYIVRGGGVNYLAATCAQAEAYAKKFPDHPSSKRALEYSRLKDVGFFSRKMISVRNRFFPCGLYRQIVWWIFK